VRSETELILNGLLEAEEDDIDFKEVYQDTSAEGLASQIVHAFMEEMPEEGRDWVRQIGEYTVTLEHRTGARYLLRIRGPHIEPWPREFTRESGWAGMLSPKSLRAAAMRVAVPFVKEHERRTQVGQLYQAFESALARDPHFKAWVESLEEPHEGHTTIYDTMTPEDVTYWLQVLKQHGH
jgi:hypothetical protein